MNRLVLSIKKLLPDNRFARNVSVLAGGTAAGQLIVIVASPILTRLYAPKDFGLLAVYAGILGILSVVASLRYQLAIPLPQSDDEAANISVLSLLAVVVTTLLTTAAVWLFGTQIVSLLNTPELAPYLWLVPVGLFLVGVYQVFQYWAIRTKEFTNIARTRLIQSLVMVITQMGGYALGPLALILGRIVGQSAGVIGLAKSALGSFSKEFSETTAKGIQVSITEYKSFPLVSTWTGLASSSGSNLPPILIAAFFGAGPAGIFALSHRVLSQPMAIVGRAVGDVFYREAAEAHRKDDLGRVVDRVYSNLVILTLPPAVTGFLVLPEIFTLVFGENWSEAGDIARWMTPWLFFQLVVTPPTRVYPILGLHGVALRFQLSLMFSTVFSILIGGWVFKDLVFTVALLSTINSLVYLWRASYTFGLVGLKRRYPILLIVRSVPISFLCNLPIIILIAWRGSVFQYDLINISLVFVSVISLVVVGFLGCKRIKS